jgi:hypothetical protein
LRGLSGSDFRSTRQRDFSKLNGIKTKHLSIPLVLIFGFAAFFATGGSCRPATGWAGVATLLSNTTGDVNTATGINAFRSNTDGIENTATGFGALLGNITGDRNTASGVQALLTNTTGDDNTAIGYAAL